MAARAAGKLGVTELAFLSDGAFEEQRGSDWAPRWWRASDSGLVAPIMIANGRRIDQLEERLGVKLFKRSTRKVTLTPEGTTFFDDCHRVLDDLRSAEDSLTLGAKSASGRLIVTAPTAFGRKHIAPHLSAFIAERPNLAITLHLSERLVDLKNERFDLVIDDDKFKIGNAFYKLARFYIEIPRRLKILPNAIAQIFRLADVDYRTGAIAHNVHAWGVRQGRQALLKSGGAFYFNQSFLTGHRGV